jgi:hypothetical protein
MGISSDGILIFGAGLVDEEGRFSDWGRQELFARALNDDFADPEDFYAHDIQTRLNGNGKGYNITLELFCSDGCSFTVLGLRSTLHIASRGFLEDVTFTPNPDAQAIKDFAAYWGLRLDGEPRWVLCSWMG